MPIDERDIEYARRQWLSLEAVSYFMIYRAAVFTLVPRILDGTQQDIVRKADTFLLVGALRNLTRSVTLALRNAITLRDSERLERAMREFEESLPGIREARNAIEHFDDYLVNRGRRQQNSSAEDYNVFFSSRPDGEWILHVGRYNVDISRVEEAVQKLSIQLLFSTSNPSGEPRAQAELGFIRLVEDGVEYVPSGRWLVRVAPTYVTSIESSRGSVPARVGES